MDWIYKFFRALLLNNELNSFWLSYIVSFIWISSPKSIGKIVAIVFQTNPSQGFNTMIANESSCSRLGLVGTHSSMSCQVNKWDQAWTLGSFCKPSSSYSKLRSNNWSLSSSSSCLIAFDSSSSFLTPNEIDMRCAWVQLLNNPSSNTSKLNWNQLPTCWL